MSVSAKSETSCSSASKSMSSLGWYCTKEVTAFCSEVATSPQLIGSGPAGEGSWLGGPDSNSSTDEGSVMVQMSDRDVDNSALGQDESMLYDIPNVTY